MAQTRLPYVGRSLPRLEDRPLVTGQGRFAADISFAHQLHMRVVRSAHAHGRIVAIDADAARAAPGVVAVWTAADVAEIPPIDFRLTRIEGLEPYRQPILAAGPRALCRRAGRGRFRRRPLRGRGRRRPGRRSRSKHCPNCSPPMRRPANSTPAIRPKPRSCARAMATWRRPLPRRMRSSRLSLRSAGTAACRWRRAAPSRATTRRRDVLELYGAAKVPHWNRDSLARMLGPRALLRASA